MVYHQATAEQIQARSLVENHDRALVRRARDGDRVAMDKIMQRYRGFVRLKASSYFLAGGEIEDLIQEGLIGSECLSRQL